MAQGLQISRHTKIGLLWLKKWNKPLVAFLAFLIILCMTTIVIVENYHAFVSENAQTASSRNVSEIQETFSDEVNYCFVVYNGSCDVTCSKILDKDISSVVNALNFSNCSLPEIHLDLKEVYFTDNTIIKGWLSGLTRDVVRLTITSPLLGEIGESAFSGEPLEYLRKLEIVSSRIRELRKDALLNSKLQDFQFRCNNGRITIEYNALEPVSDYLTILQFIQCIDDFQAVRNITGTGTSIFNKLSEIDLRFNTFNVVLNHSFVDATQLISLYLSNNNINSVEVDAFNGIQASLQLLDLKANKLTSLPEGVFDHFTRGGQIFIQDNPWNCDCSLFWLKQFYVKNLKVYFNNGTIPFICTAGNYSDVEFCPGGSTPNYDNSSETTTSSITTTSTTSSISTISTTTEAVSTESPFIFVYLQCNNFTQDTMLQGVNRIYSHSIKVRNGSILYDFFQIEDTPYFEIEILNDVGTAYLVWINNKNSSDYGCVSGIEESVLLRNLQYGISYTICLLEESSDAVSPFDCTSLAVPLEWKNRTWIKNKYIPAVIGGVVGVALVIILVTLLIVFYTIRQNPKLIKGNKRVVIVKNKSADALVLPNYERQPYVPPYVSVCTNSEGYLTPKNRIYEQINERRFWHLNTVTRDMRSPHSNFGPRRSVSSVVYEPPPLPPNRPLERRKQFPRSESVSDIQTIE